MGNTDRKKKSEGGDGGVTDALLKRVKTLDQRRTQDTTAATS